MILKGVIVEDFVNYKKPSMVLEFPYCSFKCDKECGTQICQNLPLAKEPNIEVNMDELLKNYYIHNPITEAIVCQGLEPFDSETDLGWFLMILRYKYKVDDDYVIYTGYNENEVQHQLSQLSKFKNVIVKFGRYLPGQEPHYDPVLGVNLASDNQYARKIS